MTGIARRHYPACVRVIPVRCLGSVNAILIADAVSRGFDGVALLGCKAGEDYQCHFIRGSEFLETRMENVRETLDRLALEAERVRFMEVEITDSHRIPGLLEEFVDTIKRVGTEPVQGFLRGVERARNVGDPAGSRVQVPDPRSGRARPDRLLPVRDLLDRLSNLHPRESFPRKEMVWVQWGLKDLALSNSSIWACHDCAICTSYCPREAQPAQVMAALREYSIEHYAVPRVMGRMLGESKFLPLLFAIPALIFGAILAGSVTLPRCRRAPSSSPSSCPSSSSKWSSPRPWRSHSPRRQQADFDTGGR